MATNRTEWMNALGYTYKTVILKNIKLMKKQMLFGLALAATCAASAQTVLETKTLPAGHEMQVVKDQQGRILRQLVKPNDNENIDPASKVRKVDDDVELTYYEGFEAWQYSYGNNWIPEDWTEINTEENIPTPEQLALNINNTWFAYESTDLFQDFTPDGNNEAFIHFSYNYEPYDLKAYAQDEWLISPSISLKEKEKLQFILQADLLSVYDYSNFSWSAIKFSGDRITVNTLKVMLSTDDGKTWGEIWDLVDDVASKLTDQECYDNCRLRARYYDVDLADYAGKDIKLAFRYMREEGDMRGNSMALDGIKIMHPVSSAIHDVKTATNQDEYYDINGVKINGKPSKKGLYIRKGEGKTEKVMI